MSETVLAQLLKKWGGLCQALFEELGHVQPKELAALVEDQLMPPHKLTFAAEILGRLAPEDLAIPALLPLLQHDSAVVREGAIYGLSYFRTDQVMSELRRVAATDSSAAVQAAAADVAEEGTREYLCIFGSREGVSRAQVEAFVASLPQDTVIISGGAPGVDTYAYEAALARGMAVEIYPAQWGTYDKAAGPIRNALLVKYSTAGQAFRADGRSPGTDDCASKLRRAGKPVTVDWQPVSNSYQFDPEHNP